MLEAVERAVLTRQRRPAVRLQISPRRRPPHPRMARRVAAAWAPRRPTRSTRPLDAAALMELANWPGFEQLKNADWPPQPPRDLLGSDDLWDALLDHDVLLFHPYESFDPVVRLVEQAADDPQRAGHQADALPHQRRFADRPGPGPRGPERQGSDRAGRAAGPLRRGPQHPLGPPPGRPRLPRDLRHRRLQDARQGPADRPPPVAADPALRAPGHGQLQRPHRPALLRHRPDDHRPRHRRRRGGLLQPADRLLRGGRLVEAGHRPHRPAAAVPRPDRPRDPGLDARPAGADHGQGQLAAGPAKSAGPCTAPARRA